MKSLAAAFLIAMTPVALMGCGSDDAESTAAPRETVTVTAGPLPSETPSATASADPTMPSSPPAETKTQSPFPPGFPKKVLVSSLPDQVRSWYQMSGGNEFAVAVAPGVWTELPPGASVQDAVATGVLDGFCASIKFYERKYTPGQAHGGTCW